jgi:hypothetical protein
MNSGQKAPHFEHFVVVQIGHGKRTVVHRERVYMRKTKWMYVSAAVIATAALTLTTVGAAQADPGNDKEPVSDSSAVAVDTGSAPDAGSARGVSASAAATLAMIQNRIANYVIYNGTKYSFGSYVDPDTGKIIVDTDAPSDVVTPLTDVAGRTVVERAAGLAITTVQVRRQTTSDAWHRRDDVPPFYGGGGIAATGAICSSGYAVKTSSGSKFMVTAGHCFANGTSVRTESGATLYGTVFARRLPTVTGGSADMEVIGGSQYTARVFTGGVTSTSSIPVVAAGTAFVGYANYCHSGRTTGEQCGHKATSITAQVCTATGCKSPVIAYTGGVVQEAGDSGGTFYAKDASGAWIRGHVIAGNSTVGYVEPWTVVAAQYGVSIVT